MPTALNPQDALIAVMIATSAADEIQSTEELLAIDRIIDELPAFIGYDKDRVTRVNAIVRDLFSEEDGLDALIGLVAEALPAGFNETAYAIACDIVAADGAVKMTELRLLEMLRDGLKVGRLASAAIERGARARYQRF